MRLMMRARLPAEPFDTYVRQGTIRALVNRILEETKPQVVYFTEEEGWREALVITEVDRPSGIPALSEPWLLNFNAECEFRVAMLPDDLQESHLEAPSKKWGTASP
jgi:hypothetical protein